MPDPITILKKLQDEVTASFTALEQERQSLIVPTTPAVQPAKGYIPPEEMSMVDWAKVAGAEAINTLIKIAPSVEKPSDRPQIVPKVKPTIATLGEAIAVRAEEQRWRDLDVKLSRYNFRQEVLNVVPTASTAILDDGSVGVYKSVTDILDAFGNRDLDSTDIQFAAQVLLESKRMAQPPPPQRDQRANQELLAQITRAWSVSTYGLVVASQQDFYGRIVALQTPRLPVGTSKEDMYDILVEAGWAPEEIPEKLSTVAWVREQELAWATWQARDDVRRSEYAPVELGETAKRIQAEKVKAMTTPALAGLFIPAAMWFKFIEGQTTGPALALPFEPRGSRSIAEQLRFAALAPFTLPTAAFVRLDQFLGLNTLGEKDFYNKLTIARGMGMQDAEAYSYAVNNWSTNGLVKFLVQTITDPLILPGLRITSTILRPVPLVGRYLAGLNDGFIRVTDSAFLGLKAGLTKLGGKTVEIARTELVKGMNEGLVAAVWRANSAKYKRFREIPVGTVRDTIRSLADFSLYHPGNTTEGAFGAGVLMQKPVDLATAKSWAKRLGLELDEVAFTLDYKIVDLDNLLGQVKGLGGAQLGGEAPLEEFLRIFGADLSEANFKTASTIFNELKDGIAKQINTLTSGATVKLMLNRISRNVQEVFEATQLSEVAALRTKYVSLTGWEMFADSFTKASLVHSISALSRQTARWYLLTSAYGIMNVAEAAVKTAIAELNPFFRGNLFLLADRDLGGLVGVPESLRAVGFIKELGPVGRMRDNAQASIIMRRPETSINAMRRVLRDITAADISRAITDIPETIFIKIGARLGAQQNLNFVLQAYRRALVNANPEVLLRATKYAQQMKPILLKAGYSPKMTEQIVDESLHRIATDYRQIDNLYLDWTPDVMVANHLEKLLGPYKEIGPYVADALREEIQAGRLMPQLSEVFGTPSTGFKGWAHEMVYDDILSRPELVAREIQSMVSEILNSPAQTLEALQHQMVILDGIVTTVSNTVDTQVKMGQHIGIEMTNKIKKGEHFETLIEKRLEPFLKSSKSDIDRLVAELKTRLTVVPTANQQAYDALLDKYLRHAASYANVRERQFAFEDVMKAEFGGNTPPTRNPRANDWWEEFITGRSRIWNEEIANLLQEAASIGTDTFLLGGGTLPEPFRIVSWQITPADVARLYGTRIQDVRPGLYNPGANVFVSEDAFVTDVYGRAKRVAAQIDKTPEQLGFNREGLKDLYARMRKGLKTGEPVQNLAEAAFAQLAKFREDLEYYATTKGAEFTPEMTQALRDYSKAVRAGLESDPQLSILTSRETKDFVGEGELLDLERWHRPVSEERAVAAARKAGYTKAEIPPEVHAGFLRMTPERQAEAELAEISMRYSPPNPTWEALRGEVLSLEIEIDEAIETRRYLESVYGIGSPEAVSGDNILNLLVNERLDVVRKLVSVPDTSIRKAVEEWFTYPSTESLQKFGDLVRANKPYQAEIHRLLYERYRSGNIRVFRGGARSKFPLNREYTNVTASKATAETFQGSRRTWPLGSPEADELNALEARYMDALARVRDSGQAGIDAAYESNRILLRIEDLERSAPEGGVQIDNVVIKVEDVLAIGSIRESEFIIDAEVLRNRITHPIELPAPGQTQWNLQRQKALDTAVNDYYLNLPDYDHNTALNQSIKTFMPFWTYESHRPFYLARTFVQKPGLYLSMGRYKDNTDRGYFRVPGLQNVQANMFRGTIWGIVAGRNLQKDYPEYYDQYPGWSNVVTNLERHGFFFAPTLTMGASLTGILSPKRGKLQTGEAVPPVLGSLLEIFIASFPNSAAAAALQETLMSSKFRDRYIAIMVSKQGGDGDALLDKRRLGIKFEDDEQEQWNSGVASTARFNLGSIQAGMLRLKPQELVDFQELAKLTLADATGVPVAVQNEMDKYGLRIGDQFPISPEVSDLVDELEGASQWRGLSKGLGPSEASYVLQLTSQYYREIENKHLETQPQKLSLDARFRLPASNPNHIDRREWERQVRDLNTSVFEFGKQLKLSDVYKEALVEREEREEYALKYNQPLLLQHPEYELLADYFDIEPKMKFDADVGYEQTDYNSAYRSRRLIVETLNEPYQSLMKARINRYESPMEEIRRLDYEYMQPYFDAKRFVQSTLPAEHQKLIAQFEATSDVQVRAALRAELDSTTAAGGLSIISQYQSKLAEFRKRLRQLDPELDARLALWRGLTPVTTTADQLLTRLRQAYGLR